MSNDSEAKSEFPEIPDFDFIRLIGKGGYGQVYVAYDNESIKYNGKKSKRRLVAVKVINMTDK